MKRFGMAALAAGAVWVWTAAAYAGPCEQDINTVETAFDAKLNAAAASSDRQATEGTFATMHRQPTLNSVAGAEERLGEIPPAQVEAFAAAMKRAQDADTANDGTGCQRALDDAKAVLNQ
ncbi:MAG: hypothetical protein JO107_09035 [Hyphomicrobiales bacterium]|nr:hypothetical protein [Hyphomicrobiales bacterium]MBV8663232.1 hypothetical protein [Hyphomicrobiales bacterium]